MPVPVAAPVSVQILSDPTPIHAPVPVVAPAPAPQPPPALVRRAPEVPAADGGDVAPPPLALGPASAPGDDGLATLFLLAYDCIGLVGLPLCLFEFGVPYVPRPLPLGPAPGSALATLPVEPVLPAKPGHTLVVAEARFASLADA